MGEGGAGCNTRLIDDYADCDRYGTVGVVAIKLDGRYCWECIPDDELAGRMYQEPTVTQPFSSTITTNWLEND